MAGFLDFGSPEALEKALTAGESEDFVVYNEGLCYASVCSSLPVEEVQARMQRRPSGTTRGWRLSEEAFAGGQPNPCPCDQRPDTHKHYVFVA